jgi:hypothetical protein
MLAKSQSSGRNTTADCGVMMNFVSETGIIPSMNCHAPTILTKMKSYSLPERDAESSTVGS